MYVGQYWLTSWGYKTSLALDNDKLVRLGRQAVEVRGEGGGLT